jgi:hypothetical protein
VDVPDVFREAFVMEKDSKRFPKSGGWGYAVFNYDAASDQGEMATIDKVDLGVRNILAVALWLARVKRCFVFTPDHEQPYCAVKGGIHRWLLSFSLGRHDIHDSSVSGEAERFRK